MKRDGMHETLRLTGTLQDDALPVYALPVSTSFSFQAAIPAP
jgi:hypothetical protein